MKPMRDETRLCYGNKPPIEVKLDLVFEKLSSIVFVQSENSPSLSAVGKQKGFIPGDITAGGLNKV